jgi:hypothetical protein
MGAAWRHRHLVWGVFNVPPADITEAQRRYLAALAWRYRRQMPADLVPSKDAVDALHLERQQQLADARAAKLAQRKSARVVQSTFLPLFSPSGADERV